MTGFYKNLPPLAENPYSDQKQKKYYSAISYFFSQAVRWYARCFLTPYIYEVTAGRSIISHY